MKLQQTKKSIAIDMDGVLVDIETHFINWYEKEYGLKVSRESLLGKPEGEAFPEKNAIKRFIFTKGFFRTAPVMEGAVQAVKALMEQYEVYVVSAAMEFPQSLPEKRDWLYDHFPFIHWKNIIFCGDKSIIDTDYMIDDHCKNLDHFKGMPIMFSAAHNAGITRHTRVNSWAEVLGLFQLEQNAAARPAWPSW
ncbi:MAG TPA: hypothetical protein VNU72_05820 [Puia sp.]|jgi:5'-nucleotidase|nr:hypothetical protein [Puia sp.]